MSIIHKAGDFATVEQATGTAGAAVTLTIAAMAGMHHAITGINIQRSSAAGEAGNAILSITTTNLPDSMAWSVGDVMAAGGTQRDVNLAFDPPLLSSVVGTATTIVMPDPGTDPVWTAQAFYYMVPAL
jgi:hypothetical protein